MKTPFYLDEPVYNNSSYRRKSVFAEAYNPEDDEGEETKVAPSMTVPPSNSIVLRLFTQSQTNKGLGYRKEFRLVSFSKLLTTLS